MQFMVEMKYSNGRWDDAGWEEDDKPLRFNSFEEGQTAIDEFCQKSFGNYTKEEFRVIPILKR